jgi:hypothetical protein
MAAGSVLLLVFLNLRLCPYYKLATAADFQKATERVYFGGKNASMIVLPVVKK